MDGAANPRVSDYDVAMHPQHTIFLDAIAHKRRLSVRFFDKKTGKERTRVCAPLDFGPLRGATDTRDRYPWTSLVDTDFAFTDVQNALLQSDNRSVRRASIVVGS